MDIKFEIKNYRQGLPHPSYGQVIVTLSKLLTSTNHRFELRNLQNAVVGTLSFDNIRILEKPSFVDYLRSGWYINLACAIDFTASNGELSDPNSLHHQSLNGHLNNYEEAITSVGNILEPYAF